FCAAAPEAPRAGAARRDAATVLFVGDADDDVELAHDLAVDGDLDVPFAADRSAGREETGAIDGPERRIRPSPIDDLPARPVSAELNGLRRLPGVHDDLGIR